VQGKGVAIAGYGVASAPLIKLAPTDPRWLRLVESAPEATAFHQPAWLKALTRAYGYEALILALVDAEGAVIGGIPVARVRRPLSGVAHVSLPFTDHCPPIARDEAALQLLAASVGEWCRREAGPALEIRGRLPEGSGLRGEAVGVRHLLPLDGARHELNQLKPSVARHVRASERAGVSVRISRSREDMQTFYRLHVQTRRRLGVPVQPRRFLNAVWEHVVEPGMGFVAIAQDDGGEPIASALFLAHGHALIYKFGASDASRWELKPNHLLFWTAIGWGRENGFRVLDFGKSDLASDGLRRFKSGWGAQEVPLEYMTSGPPGGGLADSERLAGALKAVISHSPVVVCRAIGELLYRYAA
jgi:CelD/BcsL family acetyltransferase involved in cellulose biosynthesis